MKIIQLSENLIFEVSEGEEFFSFAQKVLNNHLFVKTFSLKRNLIKMLRGYKGDCSITKKNTISKVKDSFIGLLKYNNKYIGLCCFFEYYPVTIQSFISPKFRGNNYAYMIISEVLQLVKQIDQNKKIAFHYGNNESVILFYKLWINKLIKLKDLIRIEDQAALRYIKYGLKGKHSSFGINPVQRELLDKYILSKSKKMVI